MIIRSLINSAGLSNHSTHHLALGEKRVAENSETYLSVSYAKTSENCLGGNSRAQYSKNVKDKTRFFSLM